MADEPDAAAIAEAAATFREHHDGSDAALETVLDVDAEHDTWTFDDIALDSGTFGELVSRGIVTKVDGEYAVSSREGIRSALDGGGVSIEAESETSSDRSVSLPVTFGGRAAGALVGALVFLFGTRLVNYRSVFRDDRVVSPANDPYYYRYWMEELLAESNGITDWSVVTNMPAGAAERRPFTHAANWFAAELLGGDQWAADVVAAWLPVLATVALGVVLYWLAVVLTDDVRVGIASVVLFALMPAHAAYTGIGFLEHRLHQYFWLGVTLLVLAWLAVDLTRRRERASTTRDAVREHLRYPWTWIAAVTLGVATGLSLHVWGGSILLLVPVAAYVGLKVAMDVRAGLPPAASNAPILVGLAGGWGLATLFHVGWGWHETFVTVVPLLVIVGGVAVVGLGELWRRLEWPVGALVGLEVGLVGLGLIGVRQLRPEEWARLSERAGDLFGRGGISEAESLFSLDGNVILEPMVQLGVAFYIAIVALMWACLVAWRRYEPGWLVLATYTVFWLLLAAIQARFAAQLAIPLSVLGGLGLVYLLAGVNIARVPAPFRDSARRGSRRDGAARQDAAADGGEREPSIVVPRDPKTLLTLVWIVLLVCGLSLFFVPSLSGQTTHSDAQIETAMAIDEHAETVDREYPESYVLSQWGANRLYNYVVSGEAERYSYAFDNFDDFRADDDPDDWHGQFPGGGNGYVVLTDAEGYPDDSAQVRLHDQLGTGGNGYEPLEHYQAIHIDDDVTAFAIVPGATITAPGEPGETVTVETDVTVSEETLTYTRDVTVAEDGMLAVRVPYPGTYTVGEQEIDVSTNAVETGSTMTLE